MASASSILLLGGNLNSCTAMSVLATLEVKFDLNIANHSPVFVFVVHSGGCLSLHCVRILSERRIHTSPLCRRPELMICIRLLRCCSSIPRRNLSVGPSWRCLPGQRHPTPTESLRHSDSLVSKNSCANLLGDGFESAVRFQSVLVCCRRIADLPPLN